MLTSKYSLPLDGQKQRKGLSLWTPPTVLSGRNCEASIFISYIWWARCVCRYSTQSMVLLVDRVLCFHGD